MTNASPAQTAAINAFMAAVIDRQCYVLKGVMNTDPKVDHAKLNEIMKLMSAVERVSDANYRIDVSELMRTAEAIALEMSLLG